MKRPAPNHQPASQPHTDNKRTVRAGIHTSTAIRAGGLVAHNNSPTLLPKDFQHEESRSF
ncbi:MAG: hypothetical protein DRR08_07410 [Candidatus Parabeggiatoa sp. nov. 2]|nr:MAG: hypothetical protein B6247_07145 [Beggiatoa sp. 4572_84]RKZ61916.1 MAG: hypothetical protein DRR08_07410 [Gammaproteobacteria bacterium]HEC83806.1 hypothetical protein [Thioploca sp.]